MSNTITVTLSDGSTVSGTLAEIKAQQKSIIRSDIGAERLNLQSESKKAGDAAYEAHMDAFYAEAIKNGGAVDGDALRAASAVAGKLATTARQQVYLNAGRLQCPNFAVCGGLRQPRFADCARCAGKVDGPDF